MKKLILIFSLVALLCGVEPAAAAKTKLLEPVPENCIYFTVEDLLTKYFGLFQPGTSASQVQTLLEAKGLNPNKVGADIEVHFIPNGSFAGRRWVSKFGAVLGAPVVSSTASFDMKNWRTSDSMTYDFPFSQIPGKNAFQKSAEQSMQFAQFMVSEIEKLGIKLEFKEVDYGQDWKYTAPDGDYKISLTRRHGNGANYYWVRLDVWDMHKKPWVPEEKKEEPAAVPASTPSRQASSPVAARPASTSPSAASVPYLDILNKYSSADPTHISGNIISSEKRNVGRNSDVYIFRYDNGWEKTVQVMPCWGCINGVNGMMQRCAICSGTGVKVIISAQNPKTGYYTDPNGNPVAGGGSGAAAGSSSGGSSVGGGSGSGSSKSGSLYKTCHYCHGTGACSSCKGKGVLENTYSGGWYNCTSCSGTGHCFNCNGRGRY